MKIAPQTAYLIPAIFSLCFVIEDRCLAVFFA